jgi:serine/threonine-protein kinase HipA
MQRGIVYRNGIRTGEISRDEKGVYRFRYDAEYLDRKDAAAISVNFPLCSDAFVSDTLFPFFFNMLAEGSTKEIQCRELKIDPEDHFSRLLKTARANTIGAVTVEEV